MMSQQRCYQLENLFKDQEPMIRPLDMMINYLSQNSKYAFEIKGTLLSGMMTIGSQGCGKTVWTKSVIGACCLPANFADGIDESQIAVMHGFRVPIDILFPKIQKDYDLPKLKHIYYINDDVAASEGGNARQSLKKENVETGKYYIMIRHELEAAGFDGKFTIFPLTQVFHLMDKTLRVGCKIKAYKDYPDELNDIDEARMILGRKGLFQLRSVSNLIWSAETQDDKIRGYESCVTRFIRYPTVRWRCHRTPIPEECYRMYGEQNIVDNEMRKEEQQLLKDFKKFKLKKLEQGTSLSDPIIWKCWKCGKEWKLRAPPPPRQCIKCWAKQSAQMGVQPGCETQ